MEKGNLKFWKRFSKLSILQRKINISYDLGITRSRISFAHEMDMGTEKPGVTISPKVSSPAPKIPDTWILTETQPTMNR